MSEEVRFESAESLPALRLLIYSFERAGWKQVGEPVHVPQAEDPRVPERWVVKLTRPAPAEGS